MVRAAAFGPPPFSFESGGAAMTQPRARAFAVILSLGLALSACGMFDGPPKPADRINPYDYLDRAEGLHRSGSIFGGDPGIRLFGPSRPTEDAGGGIGVNSFLWRASLDSVSFMPLASADPFGGVIITDWYSPPESPNERFKLNVYILGRQLRADGLKAAVFRQRRDASGEWQDASVESRTITDLENSILTRARQLRIDSASN
jgi:hypothetical protein